jgi:hypothetical protein
MKKTLALVALLAPAFSEAASPLPSCNVERTAAIHFSDASHPDALRVAVKGAPCWDGKATITITSSEGKVLYHWEKPYKPLNPVQWDDPGQPALARDFVESTITNGLDARKRQLPRWIGTAESFEEEHYASPAVSRARYEALRRRKLPVFYHQTYYEGGVYLVYDPEEKEVVIVLEGGL